MDEFEKQENAPRGNPAHSTAASRRIVLLEVVEQAAKALLRSNGDEADWAALRVALHELDTARAEGYPR